MFIGCHSIPAMDQVTFLGGSKSLVNVMNCTCYDKVPKDIIFTDEVDPVHPATQVLNVAYVRWDPEHPEVPWALFPTARITHRSGAELRTHNHTALEQLKEFQGKMAWIRKAKNSPMPPSNTVAQLLEKTTLLSLHHPLVVLLLKDMNVFEGSL